MNMKKIVTLFISFVIVFSLAACSSEYDVQFKLDGEIHETRTVEPGDTATTPMPSLPGQHFLGWYTDEDYADMFDRSTPVEDDMTLYGKTVPFEGNDETPVTDMLKLESEQYVGKSFPEDGIGEVTLRNCIDGDTTHFDSETESDIRVRYLFTDTPESTSVVEPWGFESSDYVCDKLTAAETLVLEYEPHPDEGHPQVHPMFGRTGNYGRHLATVWYDGRNMNLETVELGYSPASGVGNTQYAEYFRLAENNANANNLRLGGDDKDPMFEAGPSDVDLEDLAQNPEEYYRTFVNVEGVVTNKSGSGFDICMDGNSFYVYTGNLMQGVQIQNNRRIQFNDLFVTTFGENYQLTNYDVDNVEVLEEDVEVDCNDE